MFPSPIFCQGQEVLLELFSNEQKVGLTSKMKMYVHAKTSTIVALFIIAPKME